MFSHLLALKSGSVFQNQYFCNPLKQKLFLTFHIPIDGLCSPSLLPIASPIPLLLCSPFKNHNPLEIHTITLPKAVIYSLLVSHRAHSRLNYCISGVTLRDNIYIHNNTWYTMTFLPALIFSLPQPPLLCLLP